MKSLLTIYDPLVIEDGDNVPNYGDDTYRAWQREAYGNVLEEQERKAPQLPAMKWNEEEAEFNKWYFMTDEQKDSFNAMIIASYEAQGLI